MLVVALIASGSGEAVHAGELDLSDRSRLRVGIGDRTRLLRDGRWVSTLSQLDRYDLEVDMLQAWLTKGWKPEWIDREELRALSQRGITPVVVHYYFGDSISKERVEAARKAWYTSLWRMAEQLRGDTPVLVILEPEWNITAPAGETSVRDWAGFAEDLRAAARMIRKRAPNVLVGTCPGDFAGPPDLERVLGPVADDLDFIAFQEMRASTRSHHSAAASEDVGRKALAFARYLRRAFDRPLLLGYLAVSSYGGWAQTQDRMLRDVLAQRDALRAAGVWGVVYFQLFDDRDHRGYFGAAEPHFGLLTRKGRPKPALEAFRELAR